MKKMFFFCLCFILNVPLNAQWEKCNIEISSTGIYTIACSGDLIIAGTMDSGLFISTDSGVKWSTLTNSTIQIESIHKVAIKNNTIYLGTFGYGFVISTDYGNNWFQKNQGLTNLDIWSFDIKNDSIILSTYDNGVYFSTNYGENWSECNNGLINLNSSDIVFDGSLAYMGSRGDGFYYTTNNGINWVQSNNGLNGNIIIPLIVNKSSIYLGTYSSEGNSGFVHRSTNQGKNWIVLNNGIPEVKISSIACRDNLLIVGTYGEGVYISTNNGDSWEEKNAGLYDGLNKNVLSLSINDEYVFIGTWGSIFRCKISDLITGIDEIQFFNNTLSLAPNPSTGTVHISFTLSMENYITLQITNNLGQVVNELISNKMFEKGKHNIDYSTLNLAKGIYFVSLKTSGKVLSEEKLIIK
jgi:photosystem II stability/assembly factor-like uncharacterized protein